MSLVVKILSSICLMIATANAGARNIHLLILGDQSAANCHAHSYGPISGIFLLGEDGREYPAADPLEWSDCKNGSIWMPLATRLKRQKGVDKVLILPISINGVHSKDWLEGAAVGRLNNALATAKSHHIGFDYALWQQGAADASTPSLRYMNEMRKTIKTVTLTVRVDKWLIAQDGACFGQRLDEIIKAQSQLAEQVMLNRFPGASIANLSPEERSSVCSLTRLGQEVMAQRWFDAIQRTDVKSRRYQKESLVYFFK